MTIISNFRRSLGLVCLALGAAVAPLQGQGLDGYATKAMTAMRKNDWTTALALLTKATDTYDARAPRLYGPRFGWFWFRRGAAELKMGKYHEAMESFKKCYVKYPNNKGEGNESINMNHKMALLYWGHAAKAAKEWSTAVKMYKKFLAERDPTRDKMQPGVFYINNSICNFKLKKFKEGSDFLEIAIKNKVKFPTPNKGIMAAFAAMVESVIEKKAEPVLLDFLAKNRGHVKLSPFEAYEYAPLFMKLAGQAKEAEMMRSTFELYSLVPSTVAAVEDVKTRLSLVGNYESTIPDGSMSISKNSLTNDLEILEKADRTGTVNEIYAFLNTAVMHEDDGNVRGAFAVYQQLEHYFPKAKIMREGALVPMRERNLYNLVRTSSAIGEVLTTERYGSRFLKAFPTSKYVPEVRRMMLTSLFWNGEYETCIEVASRMIDELKNPSKEHDICLFVLGGSYYYNGEFVKAQPLLDKHIKTYPEAAKHRRQAALYFQGSNLTRVLEWTKAAALLDAFLKKYPDPKSNIYMPFAFFDRANCHYAQDELKPALTLCNRVEKEFPGVEIMEMNYNLKGNVLELLHQRDESETYHKKALVLSETKENKMVAGEALYYLVRLIGAEKINKKENPRMQEAVPFYDKFWEEHGHESPYQAKVAVAGLPAMTKVGRTKEGLERLQGVITKISKVPGTPGLEEAINSYTSSYLEVHTALELKDHYYNFPGIDSRDQATRALLRIAVITVYEDVAASANKKEDVNKMSEAKAQIKVLFNELRSDFDPKDLSPYILVRVGDFLREKTAAPQQAKAYYQAALNRQGHDYRFSALFGMADVLGKGGPSDKAKAAQYLQKVFNSSDNRAQKEKALFRMVSIFYEQGDYTKTKEKALVYLQDRKNRKFSPVVRLYLAQAHDKSGASEDAMAVYSQIWATTPGYIKVSAPAIKRWLELTWARNGGGSDGKSDRQIAYEEGWRYVDGTKKFEEKMPPEELSVWKEVGNLVSLYEANSEIKTMKEILEEKKK